MGVIHMNGRIYDPLIGRFMSADPIIQAPGNLQNYNRYSYVMNNPLNLTDPSGFSFWTRLMRLGDRISSVGISLGSTRIYNASVNFLQGSGGYQLKSAALSFVSAFCYAGASACNAGLQYGLARGYGASESDAFRTGLIAGATTEAFTAAGGVGGADGANSLGRYAAHAAVGCASSVANGGGCGPGAAAALFGKFTSNAIGDIGGQGLTGDIARGVATVVAGGVGSVIAGGKFENGAMTAAYGYLFNQMGGRGGSGSKQPGFGYEYPADIDHPFAPTAEFKGRFFQSYEERQVWFRTQEIASGTAGDAREWLQYNDPKVQLPRSGGPLYQIFDLGLSNAGALPIAYSPKIPNVFYISLDHYQATSAQPNRWTRFEAAPK